MNEGTGTVPLLNTTIFKEIEPNVVESLSVKYEGNLVTPNCSQHTPTTFFNQDKFKEKV